MSKWSMNVTTPSPTRAPDSSLEAPPPASAAQTVLQDPVCGMAVTVHSPYVFEHRGERVYFCGAGCKKKFAADPDRYLGPTTGTELTAVAAKPVSAPRSASAPALSGPIYTCPMHPEVRRDHPGNCPKCGMTLRAGTTDAR
jgi:Cu+-exporting ATPase